MRIVPILLVSFLTVHCGSSEFSGSGSTSPSSEIKADKSKDSISDVPDEDELENEAPLQKSGDVEKKDPELSTKAPEPTVPVVPEGVFCGVHFNQGFVASGWLLEGLDTKELSLRNTTADIIGMVVLANTKVEFFNSASESIGIVNGPMRIGLVQSYRHWIPYLRVPGEWLSYPADAGAESTFVGASRIKVMPLGNPNCVLPRQDQQP